MLQFQEHRGSGSAGPLALRPEGASAPHEVGEAGGYIDLPAG